MIYNDLEDAMEAHEATSRHRLMQSLERIIKQVCAVAPLTRDQVIAAIYVESARRIYFDVPESGFPTAKFRYEYFFRLSPDWVQSMPDELVGIFSLILARINSED